MLHLKLPTDPRWANVVEKNIEDILTDHAYCEQKATSSCISLIVQYSHLEALVNELTPIVAEEWSHFERVLDELKKRQLTLGKQRPDVYVNELMKRMQKGGSQEQHLLDKLLVCALIEARSCERFKTLWQNLPDKELAQFYYEFMVSEARHYTTFISLARQYINAEKVEKRWQYFLKEEALIIQEIGLRPDRMH